MTVKKYKVCEIFGTSCQGEGPWIGRKSVFIRFAGCVKPYCSWCDTAKFMDEYTEMTTKEIVSKVESYRCDHVVITGGSPELYDLEELVYELQTHYKEVSVETAGFIFRKWLSLCDSVVISPKGPSSGRKFGVEQKETLVKVVTDTIPVCALKVVVFNAADYTFALRIHKTFPKVPLYLQVGNEVGEDTTYTLLYKLRQLMDRVMKDRRFNSKVYVLPQLHVLLWGNRRGK